MAVRLVSGLPGVVKLVEPLPAGKHPRSNATRVTRGFRVLCLMALGIVSAVGGISCQSPVRPVVRASPTTSACASQMSRRKNLDALTFVAWSTVDNRPVDFGLAGTHITTAETKGHVARDGVNPVAQFR